MQVEFTKEMTYEEAIDFIEAHGYVMRYCSNNHYYYTILKVREDIDNPLTISHYEKNALKEAVETLFVELFATYDSRDSIYDVKQRLKQKLKKS